MQIELENVGVVRHEVLLEVVDAVVASRPDLFRDEVMNADDQNILIMRAVEDHHFASCRRGLMRAPQKIVRQFFSGRLLERGYAAALRVHGAENVIDRTVFASGIDGLKTDEERVATLGVKQVLQVAQLFLVVSDLIRRGFVVLVTVFERWVEFAELDLATRFDPEFLEVIHSRSPLEQNWP